jgi:hypothetical protein
MTREELLIWGRKAFQASFADHSVLKALDAAFNSVLDAALGPVTEGLLAESFAAWNCHFTDATVYEDLEPQEKQRWRAACEVMRRACLHHAEAASGEEVRMYLRKEVLTIYEV